MARNNPLEMLLPYYGAAAASGDINNNELFIFGGIVKDTLADTPTPLLYVFNEQENSWRKPITTGVEPPRKSNLQAVVDKNGKMYIMIRREQLDKMGVIATANAPYNADWKFSYMTQRIGGPNFLFLNDSTLCVGSRLYPQEEVGGTKFHQSAVFLTDLNGSVKKIIRVPSGGDASYPGMVIYDGFLWYSYYSSHEEKTNIYLAKIPLDKLTYIK